MGELLLTRFVETTALLQLFTPYLSTAYPPEKSWFEKESDRQPALHPISSSVMRLRCLVRTTTLKTPVENGGS
jgi:hypothetical protein